MDPVVTALFVRIRVNTAPCDDGHVRVFSDIKVIVYALGKPALGQENGDVHGAVLQPRLYENVDPVLVLFGGDADFFRGIARQAPAVFADVVASLRNAVQIRDLP